MKFQGKNIGILGLGKSGYWSAKLAKSLKNNVFVSDSNTNVNEMFVDDLKMLGIDVEIGIHSNQILESDLIIKSPGIPNDSEIMNKINSEKIPVISEIEFAGNHSKTKNICITGTNGKTTTVSLVTEILSKEMNVLKSGNIGIPFSKIVLENKLYDQNDIDYCILELSSFQLEHCSKLKKEIDKNKSSNLVFFDSNESIDPDIDFVLAVGGDGTILRSITYVKDSDIPILGVNTGRLGFLTSVQKESIGDAILHIKNNKFSIINRTVLKVNLSSSNNTFSDYPFALNEVTIQRKDTTSLLNISCQINNKHLTNYWSDGLIISTPTGSTGYSLSNGGSIVSPESNVTLLNPIAPHNINMRSLVIPDNSNIKIDIEGDNEINLSLDSRIYSISSSNQIEILKANFTIKTIKFDDDNFYKRLREKLFWGQDMRNKNINN